MNVENLVVDRNVEIPMRDAHRLRANVYRPPAPGKYPVLMTLGPYGKDIHMSESQPDAWAYLNKAYPQVFAQSSGRHMSFETPDPEAWVPHGYVLVRIDSRGSGKSPGMLDVNAPAEYRDFHDAIEWAGRQAWSNGNIGLLGISYFAASQWNVAALRPSHLKAILPWQGTPDFYDGRTRHGGMFCSGFVGRWWGSVMRNQHGNPDCVRKDLYTGERNNGPASLGPEELRNNRVDYHESALSHPLKDEWYRARMPDLSQIGIPALVVANWGGLGLHLRGTIEAYSGIASPEKWLKVQSDSYFATFLVPENVAMQRRFFERYLRGSANGWENEPRVELSVRAPDDTVARTLRDTQWPLSGTRWTRLSLDAETLSMGSNVPKRPASVSYAAMDDGAAFSTAPRDEPLSFAGPIKLHVWVSSSTEDMDLFVTLRCFDADGKEATFYSATEARCPVTQGWMRVSHRKTDPVLSTEYLPVHPHDEEQLIKPGEIVAVDIPVWPASLALPAGHTLEVLIEGHDFARPGATGIAKGSGFFLHAEPRDRPAARFSGTNSIHTGGQYDSYLLLPVIDEA